jgi:hypothetical protein
VDAIALDVEYDSMVRIAHRFTLLIIDEKHQICKTPGYSFLSSLCSSAEKPHSLAVPASFSSE